jgi:FlaG/FlaF family flagellin (archaellin)
MSSLKPAYLQMFNLEDDESSSSSVSVDLEQRDLQGDETWEECFNRRQGYTYDEDGNLTGNPNTTYAKTYADMQYCNEKHCNQDGSFSTEVIVTITPADTPYTAKLS